MKISVSKAENDWDVLPLGKLIEIIGGGTPRTSNQEYWGGEIPWLSVVDFNNDGRWVSSTEKSITELGLNFSSTKLLNKGDLIISARGTVGALAQLKEDMAFNQSCYGLRANDKLASNDFLYYLVKHSLREILSNVHGAVFDTITKETFDFINVSIPPILEQKTIASVLSSLDDKIELLREQNKTLESIAQTIFKEWFVNFNFPHNDGKPYKDSGGEMVESELGLIPKGWKVGKFGEILSLTMGQSPSSSTYNTDRIGLPLLNGASDLQQDGIYPSKYTSKPRKIGKKNDILLCIRATIGNIQISDQEYCIGRGVAAITPTSQYYYFSLFNLKAIIEDLTRNASGSVIKGLSREDILGRNVVIPPQTISATYEPIIKHIYIKKAFSEIEVSRLVKLRELLLPKLIKGGIDINEV